MNSSSISIENQLDKKFISLSMAMEKISSGNRIVTSMAAAEPRAFLENLAEYASNFEAVELFCANPSTSYKFFSQTNHRHLHTSVLFVTPAICPFQGQNAVHYVPQHLSQWFKNISQSGTIDIFWGSCSTPDQRGIVSLGTGACYETEALRRAKCVILEMNPQVPFTHGSTTIALKHVDHLIWNPFVLPEPNLFEPTPADLKIGDLVAEMVTDGATLQLGIGSIPNAIGKSLKNHKNLGIHSEMINDAMLELAELGVIDGSMKTLWRGKMVGSFAYGSRKLYDFINKNPAVELHPASVINDVDRIAKNHKMTSVNSAIEIDLTGQVCSESIGHKEISGVGGASETHIGAQKSKHGQAIIAMKSSAKGNSKIVFELQRGAKVSVSRNDIDTVVTEYGVARLKGQSVCERAKSLISIAHPDFRDDLTRLAKDQNYI